MTLPENGDMAETSALTKKTAILSFTRSLILATGAVAAVILNALAGVGDHPHLAALFIRWFAALPFLVIGVFYAGLIYFGHFRLPAVNENDRRPRWLVAAADFLIAKTPHKVKTALHWSAEMYVLLLMLAVVGVCLVFGGVLLLEGAVLFAEVNSLLYQQQLELLSK